MRIQVISGIVSIALGIVFLIYIQHNLIRLVYGIPLLLIGVALVINVGREDVIEEIEVKT